VKSIVNLFLIDYNLYGMVRDQLPDDSEDRLSIAVFPLSQS